MLEFDARAPVDMALATARTDSRRIIVGSAITSKFYGLIKEVFRKGNAASSEVDGNLLGTFRRRRIEQNRTGIRETISRPTVH